VVLETDGTGATQASYVLGGSELLSQKRGSTSSYYLKDGQGSVRTLLDGLGAATDRYSYDAFGAVQNRTGTTANNYQYTGQQYDVLSGLYDLRARYYNPSDGRFLSRDTYPVNFNNPIELNRYGYTANNSVNASDPSGLLFALDYPVGGISPSGRLAPVLKGLGSVVRDYIARIFLQLTSSFVRAVFFGILEYTASSNWHFTVALAIASVAGRYVPLITVNFSEGISQEVVNKAEDYIRFLVHDIELYKVYKNTSNTTTNASNHAERLMVRLLEWLDFTDELDWPQTIPGLVLNSGICFSRVRATDTGELEFGRFATYTINDARVVKLILTAVG